MHETHTLYLNHAGTSWPKPTPVLEAAAGVASLDPAGWPALFESAHRQVAEFFHVDSSRLLLTPSCTAAISIGVSDHDWQTGDRAITSGYEHHALHRTLVKLSERGVVIVTLPHRADELIDLDALELELKAGGVRLLALSAACNVTGQLLPIREAIDLAHQYGALVLVDGAQIAGWWDLDLHDLKADLFTFAGHKAPHAPWGVGGLYVSPGTSMNCPYATCQRAESQPAATCATMPGYCDVGSVNLAAVAGMAAACRWLNEPRRRNGLQESRKLASDFCESLRDLPGLVLHGDVPWEKKVPTVAITLENRASSDVGEALRERGLIASGGHQCAPQAHQSLGTDSSGVVRFSFGLENTASDVTQAVELLRELLA